MARVVGFQRDGATLGRPRIDLYVRHGPAGEGDRLGWLGKPAVRERSPAVEREEVRRAEPGHPEVPALVQHPAAVGQARATPGEQDPLARVLAAQGVRIDEVAARAVIVEADADARAPRARR